MNTDSSHVSDQEAAAGVGPRKAAILTKWFQAALADYGPEPSGFLARRRDPFANPVGTAHSRELTALLDIIIESGTREEARGHLEAVVKIRAVQDLAPSRALAFIMELKDIIREELPGGEAAGRTALLERLDARIDGLALLGFDVYTACREKIFELKTSEVGRRTMDALRRAKLLGDEDRNGAADAAGRARPEAR